MALDMKKLRQAAAEFGYWPASSDDAHLEFLREQNARIERNNGRINWSQILANSVTHLPITDPQHGLDDRGRQDPPKSK
jgi:hypothetical protein